VTCWKEREAIAIGDLALCSNPDHLDSTIKTTTYAVAGAGRLEVAGDFLFYTQDIHNHEEGFNILCRV